MFYDNFLNFLTKEFTSKIYQLIFSMISKYINYIDECPLGVGALAGTSYRIDRNFTSKKLGFKKPTNNSIDSVSDRQIEFVRFKQIANEDIAK